MLAEPINAIDFTLEVANGPAVTLSGLWGERQLLLWFSRGLACPFCRRQIVQLARIQEELQAQDTSVVLVTQTELELARNMLKFYPVAWPYACDPGRQVARAYGMDEPEGALKEMASALREQARSMSLMTSHPAEPHPEVLQAIQLSDQPPAAVGGMALVDRRGRLRYRQPSGKLALLPSNDDILKVVRQLAVAG